MKIILLKDVPGVGSKYDIRDVSAGYARNFLFRRGLAEPATENRVKAIERMRKQAEQKKDVEENLLEKNIKLLEGLKISIEAKANKKGHLFSGIHREDISKALKEQKHIDIPAELIELEHTIKEIGKYRIKVRNKEFILEILAKILAKDKK